MTDCSQVLHIGGLNEKSRYKSTDNFAKKHIVFRFTLQDVPPTLKCWLSLFQNEYICNRVVVEGSHFCLKWKPIEDEKEERKKKKQEEKEEREKKKQEEKEEREKKKQEEKEKRERKQQEEEERKKQAKEQREEERKKKLEVEEKAKQDTLCRECGKRKFYQDDWFAKQFKYCNYCYGKKKIDYQNKIIAEKKNQQKEKAESQEGSGKEESQEGSEKEESEEESEKEESEEESEKETLSKEVELERDRQEFEEEKKAWKKEREKRVQEESRQKQKEIKRVQDCYQNRLVDREEEIRDLEIEVEKLKKKLLLYEKPPKSKLFLFPFVFSTFPFIPLSLGVENQTWQGNLICLQKNTLC